MPSSNRKTMKNQRNRFKYYSVTTTSIVQAPSQAEAMRVLNKTKGAKGSVMGESQDFVRITATEARGGSSDDTESRHRATA